MILSSSKGIVVADNPAQRIFVPGTVVKWKIDFYDTKTGTDIISSKTITSKGKKISIPLPDFTDDIAFKMYAQK